MQLTNSLLLATLSSAAAVMAASCPWTPSFSLDVEHTGYIFKGKSNGCAGKGSFPDGAPEITKEAVARLGSSFVDSIKASKPGDKKIRGCVVQHLPNSKFAQLDFTWEKAETFHITELCDRNADYIVEAFMDMWRGETGPEIIWVDGQHTGPDSPDHNRGDKKYPMGRFQLIAEKVNDPQRKPTCPNSVGE